MGVLVWMLVLVIWIGMDGKTWSQMPIRDSVLVTIVHSNDMQGQLGSVEQKDAIYGGMARRVYLIRALREAGPALVLDAGNAFGPDALSAWDHGKTMAEVMGLAEYSAMTPGNHEFDYGLEALAERQKESGMPFLAANVRGRDLPLEGYRLFERDGVKIGVVGIVSSRLGSKINPKVAELLTLEDPVKVFQEAVGTLKTLGAHYIIGLVHMPVEEAMSIAQRVAEIDLIVAGGYQGLDRMPYVPALTRLVNGVHLVTTPRGGSHLGVVKVKFARSERGYSAVDVQAQTLVVDEKIPVDVFADAMIEKLETAYAEETGDALGMIAGKTRDEQAQIVVNLIRWHTQMEIGMVHRGAFWGVAPLDSLFVRDVARFVRFDDMLVKMQLTGAQIKEIIARSKRAGKGDAGLVFAGLNPELLQVQGWDIQNNEPYQVVTLAYLAEGGDGYREFQAGAGVQRTGISLRSLLTSGLQAWGTLQTETFSRLDRRRVWRSGWNVEGAFRRNYFDQTAVEYKAKNENVAFLRGETSIAWNTATRYYLRYAFGPHVVLFENNNDFGQIGTSFGSLETASDRWDTKATYRRRIREWQVDPFVSSGMSTALTSGNGSRPFLWRNSLGFQRRFGRMVMQFAGRGQKDFSENQSDFGAEISLSYSRTLQQNGRLQSRVNSFFGLTDRKVISIENDNRLSFPLGGSLSLSVRQSNFIYRVDKIQGVPVDGVAFRTDLTVGLAYGLDWKWF